MPLMITRLLIIFFALRRCFSRFDTSCRHYFPAIFFLSPLMPRCRLSFAFYFHADAMMPSIIYATPPLIDISSSFSLFFAFSFIAYRCC